MLFKAESVRLKQFPFEIVCNQFRQFFAGQVAFRHDWPFLNSKSKFPTYHVLLIALDGAAPSD